MDGQEALHEFLVVAVDGGRFALPAEQVGSAVVPPRVTPLPYVPDFVEGLVNVNDHVLPLLDMRRLVAPGTARAAVSELVIVETGRAPCALRVDAVVATLQVPEDGLQAVAQEDTGDGTGIRLVSGRFVHDGNTVLVLDLAVLGQLVCAEEVPAGRRGMLGRMQREAGTDAAVTQACIVAACGTELYGIALADAMEILDLPPATPVPGAPPAVEGISLVRDEVLLVLSLPRLLGRGDAVTGARSVVVVEHGGAHYGLRLDRVEGILACPESQLRPVDGDQADLAGVVIDETRVIGLIGIARLLNDARRKQFAPFLPARRAASSRTEEEMHAILEVEVGGEGFGIPLDAVRRITRYSASVRLETVDSARASGAVSIDGAVLPVADLQALLALPDLEVDERGAWVIVGIGDQEWAIPVARARRIVDVPASAVEEITDGGRRLVRGIARIDDRLVSLLSVEPLQEAA